MNIPVRVTIGTYLGLIFIFGVVYYFLSWEDLDSFKDNGNPKRLTFFEAFYFSVLTQATVSYGDITPKSHTVRLVAIIQIMLSFITAMYGVGTIMQEIT